MSVIEKGPLWCEWGYLTVIPWYRQLLALVFGIGVMIISVYGIQQGQGPWMIVSVIGMAFLTLLLIFGVEIDQIKIADKVIIDFTDTSHSKRDDE